MQKDLIPQVAVLKRFGVITLFGPVEKPEGTGDAPISQSPQVKEAQELEKTILTKYLVAFRNLMT